MNPRRASQLLLGGLVLLWLGCGGRPTEEATGSREDGLGASRVISLSPTADAYVRATSTKTNYNNQELWSDAGADAARTFLKFDLSGIPAGNVVVKALLKLKVLPASKSGGSENGPGIRIVPDSSWSETTLNWENQPAVGFADIANLEVVSPDTVVSLDVTDAFFDLAHGQYSFVLQQAASEDGTGFHSRSATNTADRPVLEITYGPSHNVLVANQANDKCEVFDPNRTVTSQGQTFSDARISYSWGAADSGLNPSWFPLLSECKYRLNPRAQVAGRKYQAKGNLLLAASNASAGSGVAIIEKRTKSVLFSARVLRGSVSPQPHSLELLPDGNLVVVGPGWNGSGACPASFLSTTAALDVGTGLMRIYDVESGAYKDVTLCRAHGAVWDAARQVLWVNSYTWVYKVKYNGFSASTPFTELARYTYPSGTASGNTSRGGHDLSLMWNGHVLSSDAVETFELDPDSGAWLANTSANCHFTTSSYLCTPSGVPNYGGDTSTPAVKGAAIDEQAVDHTAVVVQADGTGTTGDSWTSKSITLFPEGSPYYRIQGPAAAYYKVKFWFPQ